MNQKTTPWQRYGKLALFALVIILGVSITLQFLNHRESKQAADASQAYEKMLLKVKEADFSAAKTEGEALIKTYAHTPYGPLAALMLSRMAIEKNDNKQAIEFLKIAVDLAKKGPLLDIARIRLARVLLSEAKYEEALALLPQDTKATGYATLYEEIRGDIYFKQNDLAKAKEAYGKALKAAPPGLPLTSLQLKFTDLTIKEES